MGFFDRLFGGGAQKCSEIQPARNTAAQEQHIAPVETIYDVLSDCEMHMNGRNDQLEIDPKACPASYDHRSRELLSVHIGERPMLGFYPKGIEEAMFKYRIEGMMNGWNDVTSWYNRIYHIVSNQAELGDPYAQVLMTSRLAMPDEDSVQQGRLKYIENLIAAAEGGDVDSGVALALLGTADDTSFSKQFDYLFRAAKRGRSDAAYWIAHDFIRTLMMDGCGGFSGVQLDAIFPDITSATDALEAEQTCMYRLGAEGGWSPYIGYCQYCIAENYWKGELGYRGDAQKAVRWFTLASDNGESLASTPLSMMQDGSYPYQPDANASDCAEDMDPDVAAAAIKAKYHELRRKYGYE